MNADKRETADAARSGVAVSSWLSTALSHADTFPRGLADVARGSRSLDCVTIGRLDARIACRLAPDYIDWVLDRLVRTPVRLLCADVRIDLEVMDTVRAGFSLLRVQLDLTCEGVRHRSAG